MREDTIERSETNMAEEMFREANDMWLDFKEKVVYKNRFFINHKLLDYLRQITEISKKTLESQTVLYRARLFTGDDSFLNYQNNNDKKAEENWMQKWKGAEINHRQKTGFWGYSEQDSFVPQNNELIDDGRVNPRFIKYLYTAEDPYTALVEVRPYLGSKVSVAEVRLKEKLVVANFSYETFEKLNGVEEILMYLIMKDFSKPSQSDKKSYLPTQYIAEFIKTLDLDGIRFNSSLHRRGRNITIFNYEKCEVTGSKLYNVEDICFEAKGIAPLNEKDLIHSKLEPYREKKLNEQIAQLLEIKIKRDN